jgi:hypothetical protein
MNPRWPGDRGRGGKRQPVPPGASRVFLCRYRGSAHPSARNGTLAYGVEVDDETKVGSLSRSFDGLRKVGPGFYSCPFDDGEEIFVRFVYPHGPQVWLVVHLAGCLWAESSHGAFWASRQLRGKLSRLTGAATAG